MVASAFDLNIYHQGDHDNDEVINKVINSKRKDDKSDSPLSANESDYL